MTFDLTILSLADRLAGHAAQRQSLISENIANADTRGFRARDLKPFSQIYADGAGDGGPGDGGFAAKATRAGHAGFGDARAGAAAPVAIAKLGAASPNGNTVSLEDQMTRGAEAGLQHEMALAILRSSMTILKTGIGRGR